MGERVTHVTDGCNMDLARTNLTYIISPKLEPQEVNAAKTSSNFSGGVFAVNLRLHVEATVS